MRLSFLILALALGATACTPGRVIPRGYDAATKVIPVDASVTDQIATSDLSTGDTTGAPATDTGAAEVTMPDGSAPDGALTDAPAMETTPADAGAPVDQVQEPIDSAPAPDHVPAGDGACDGMDCPPACANGNHRCGDVCVSNASVGSCGSSCLPCATSTTNQVVCAGSCVLSCPIAINDPWNATRYPAALSKTSSPWWLRFGDPAVDVATERLFLTYDDIAQRTQFAGAYAFTFTVTFTGAGAFHLDFEATAAAAMISAYEPAIRFANGQLTLGGLKYGVAMPFGTFGTFTGQTASASSANVTFYVRSGAVAARVIIAGTTYRSGFVTIPNLNASSGLWLVGANSNSDGTGRAALTALTGCAGFTDDELTAVYNQ